MPAETVVRVLFLDATDASLVRRFESVRRPHPLQGDGTILDGILADSFVQWEWLKSDAGKGFEFKGDPVFDNDKIGIAVRKGDELRVKLNAALAEIVADGTYKKINDKYFPFSIY